MAKIAFLAVNEEMIGHAKNVLKNSNIDAELKVVTSENVLDEARLSVQNGANVVIARGNHASIIKSKTMIPLVEIVLTGQDIARLIRQAKEIVHKPSPVIGFVGFKNMFSSAKPLDEILGVTVNLYSVSLTEDLGAAVARAAEDKVDLIIGGEIANSYADDLGIPTLFLLSGEDSIREAFRVAEKVAYAIELEKKNSAEFKTILDYSFDGLIKLNEEGTVIIFNYLAEKILSKRSEEAVGKHISEVFNLLDGELIQSVLTEGREYQSKIIQKANLALVANIAPIIVDSHIEGAILSFQEFKKIEELEAEIRKEAYSKGYVAKNTFKEIIGQSKSVSEIRRLAKIYADHDSPVMISGETGTGKKQLAESIHNESLRRNNPFVMIDCASMPYELLEKRLYGFVEGIHMSSTVKKGLFEIAHTGTLFLDKITELNQYAQASLLRAMREGIITRVGEDRPFQVNVRIICSVNRNINRLISEGKFNEELYYMLNVLPLNIPPLRERKDDLASMLEHYIEYYNSMYRKHIILTDAAKEVICSYPWYGNVRQLKSFCERVVILAPKKVLDEEFIHICLEDYDSTFDENKMNTVKTDKVVVYKNPEASKIMALLEIHNGNRAKVAEGLNISKTTLWRKMKKYNIDSKFDFGESRQS